MNLIDQINESVELAKEHIEDLAKVAMEIAPEVERAATLFGLEPAVFCDSECVDFVIQPKGRLRRLTISVYDDGEIKQSRVSFDGKFIHESPKLTHESIEDAIRWIAN